MVLKHRPVNLRANASSSFSAERIIEFMIKNARAVVGETGRTQQLRCISPIHVHRLRGVGIATQVIVVMGRSLVVPRRTGAIIAIHPSLRFIQIIILSD